MAASFTEIRNTYIKMKKTKKRKKETHTDFIRINNHVLCGCVIFEIVNKTRKLGLSTGSKEIQQGI